MTLRSSSPLPGTPRAGIPRWLSLLVFAVIVAGAVWRGERSAETPDRKPAETDRTADAPRPSPTPQSETRRSEPSKSLPQQKSSEATATREPDRQSEGKPSGEAGKNQAEEADKRLRIANVTIRDQNGRVVYKGEIDLKPTLDRIESGKKNQHRNDGSTFENREGRLPKKPRGYYREYVHPTPGVSGPGPQRVVIGEEDEVFYTHDHYRSFRRIR